MLTYNIRHGTDLLGRDRLADQAAIIRSAEADVVLLQEVDRGTRRSERTDLAARLAELSGLTHVAFGANHRLGDGDFGNAILARWPLAEVANHPIPRWQPGPGLPQRLAMTEQRGILEALVTRGDRRVRLLCTHFGFHTAEPLLGARRAMELIQSDDGPLVFGGDLNSPDSRSACHRLLRTTLADCVQMAGSPPEPTFPAPWPHLRLDYLYVRGLTVRWAAVPATTASDHRPLVAELVMGAGEQ